MPGLPMGDSISQMLGSLAKGLGDAGKQAGKGPRMTVRQAPAPAAALPGLVPGMPAVGSPESWQQASSIVGGLANGLKGSMPGIAEMMQGLADGLAKGGQAAKGA